MVFKILCVLLGGVAQPVWNLSWRLERRSEGRSVAVVIENASVTMMTTMNRRASTLAKDARVQRTPYARSSANVPGQSMSKNRGPEYPTEFAPSEKLARLANFVRAQIMASQTVT